jgi:hypothetical protein
VGSPPGRRPDGQIPVAAVATWRSENDVPDLIIDAPRLPVTMATLLPTINNAMIEVFKGIDESFFFEGLNPVGDGVLALRMGN